MNDKLPRMFGQALITLVPYIMLGVAIACIIGLFILSYYLLLWGLIIGATLWVFALLKRYLFSEKQAIKKHKGRIIDHDKNQ